MAVIKEVPVRANGSTVLIPVVTQGSSILPSKVRVRIAGQTGELPLVHTDDNRASKIRVRQGGATYCVAKDPRDEIAYSPNLTISRETGSSTTGSTLVATTHFNRVTRIEATIRVGVRWRCRNFALTSPYHSARTRGWISVRGPTNLQSSYVERLHGENHHVANSDFWTSWYYQTGSVVLNVTPGLYQVHLHIEVTITQSSGHSAVYAYGNATLQTWKEIARG